MTTATHLNLRLIIAAILTIIGAGLLIAGFVVPPLGVIDSSILVAFGETCTFIAALLGIDYHYKYKIFVKEESERTHSREDDIM